MWIFHDVKAMNLLSIALALVLMAVAGCSPPDGSGEASGPGFCNKFSTSRLDYLSAIGDLKSARELRDFYMDCDVSGKYMDKALHWARVSAAKGDASDTEALNILLKYHGLDKYRR